MLSKNAGKKSTILRRLKSLKGADLIDKGAEAWDYLRLVILVIF